MAFDPPTAWRPQHPPAASIYVRRRLAALGLEGLLLAVRTLSVTRLRFRLSGPSLDPKSELFFSLSLLDFLQDCWRKCIICDSNRLIVCSCLSHSEYG